MKFIFICILKTHLKNTEMIRNIMLNKIKNIYVSFVDISAKV